SSRASSRTSASPPCSDTWRSWMARASARVIQMIMPRLFGELAEDIAILPHDFFGNVHLCRELRIVDGQADTIRRLQRIQLIALVHAKPGQQLLGQDEPRGIADGGDFQLHGTPPMGYNRRYTYTAGHCLSGLDRRQKLFAHVATLVVYLARHEIQPATVAPLRP